jgi:hypothetical protein
MVTGYPIVGPAIYQSATDATGVRPLLEVCHTHTNPKKVISAQKNKFSKIVL